MTTGPTGQSPDGDGPAGAAILVALVAVVLAFFLQGVAAFLALLVLGCAVILLVRRRRHRDRRGLAIGAAVVAVVALVIAGATGEDAPPAPVAAGPAPPDPNALPAQVVVVSVNAPDDLVTDTGRRLHVPAMRWYRGPDACRVAAGRTATSELVVSKQVTVTAPDPSRVGPASVVPPGAQAVTLTLPDGRDYVQAWAALAPRTSRSACSPLTTTPLPPTTTTTEEAVPSTVEEQPDIDRRYVPDVPEPRTRARSGQSGHPCLPGERDGDGDGFCGE